MAVKEQDLILVGKIVGIFGVGGWVKIFSHTSPKANIFTYGPWQVKLKGQWQTLKVLAHRPHGKGLVAKLESYSDREQVRELIGCEVAIQRSQLPKSGKDEYYWAELIGLDVFTRDGLSLGKVDHMIATGANDVLVVKGEDRERLVPFIQGMYVEEVNIDEGLIRVDWDPEF